MKRAAAVIVLDDFYGALKNVGHAAYGHLKKFG